MSDFLLIYVLGVESPKDVVPNPTQTVLNMSLSVDAVETLTYHWLFALSHWTGWPISPEFLSDTLLTIVRVPPRLLIASAFAFNASVSVFASLISVLVDIPALALASVIA